MLGSLSPLMSEIYIQNYETNYIINKQNIQAIYKSIL
jgi:hypothetical protein